MREGLRATLGGPEAPVRTGERVWHGLRVAGQWLDPARTPACAAVVSLHAISIQSLHDLGRSPFVSALALDFARAGRLITSSHSLSGFGSCYAAAGAVALVASARLAR